ncbi:MAG: right-handed parallel beta-helix repeat-containing protein, partial [Myxococcota bacterium]
LSVTGFTTGVRVQSGDAVLRDIEVWGNSSDGFNVSVNTTNPVTSVTATDCRFRDNGLHGFEAATPSDSPVPYVLTGVTSADNGQRGIYLVQSVQMTLIDSVVEGNDFQGISMLQDARLEAIGVTVRDNDLEGVLGSGNTTLVIEDALIRGQQQHGIEFSGQSLRLRDADVINNVAGAVRIAGEPVVDLGTLADPGGNRLGIDGAGISLGDHLHDDRPADSEPAISAVGVSLGANPAHTGLVTGPDNDSPYWAIDRAGNQIDFGN